MAWNPDSLIQSRSNCQMWVKLLISDIGHDPFSASPYFSKCIKQCSTFSVILSQIEPSAWIQMELTHYPKTNVGLWETLQLEETGVMWELTYGRDAQRKDLRRRRGGEVGNPTYGGNRSNAGWGAGLHLNYTQLGLEFKTCPEMKLGLTW
jgi:hypothetical protein